MLLVLALSGCGYTSYYANGAVAGNVRLSSNQADRLNSIMFTYLNIPVLKFSVVTPPTEQEASNNNFYQPSPAIEHLSANKVKKMSESKANQTNNAYKIKIIGKKLFIRIFRRKTLDIRKLYNIKKIAINIIKIKYYKGYEMVILSLKNLGSKKNVSENFKYSNAGKIFKINKYEVIENLTVAEKYKRGMILWLKFS